jgi:hypothetical protein
MGPKLGRNAPNRRRDAYPTSDRVFTEARSVFAGMEINGVAVMFNSAQWAA